MKPMNLSMGIIMDRILGMDLEGLMTLIFYLITEREAVLSRMRNDIWQEM